MTKLIRAVVDRWLLWALFSSALMLAIAHAFETFGGYAPCTLCLRQREVYWVAGTIALAGVIATRLPRLAGMRWLFDAALAVAFAVGVFFAVYHSGAEWKWWPGPTTCAGAGGAVSLDSLAAIADGTARIRPPACDEAAWRFLGLSMAGWNALISLKLTVYSVLAVLADRKRT
ncbi:MAG TPA: disulfide bond formation protein B [Phenylobacterium sp.]|nr:disulfide bond formation protein B [Phenylobacterium sp.]